MSQDGTSKFKQVSEDVPVRGTGYVILWIERRGLGTKKSRVQ